MPIDFEEDSEGTILLVQVCGKLTTTDFEKYVPETERLIKLFGKIRIMIEIRDFHGWELGAIWDDLKFELKHFNDIERLAIVGESMHAEKMSLFFRLFTTASIQYFNLDQTTVALNWIHDGIRQPILVT
jgi:hypothetical protein